MTELKSVRTLISMVNRRFPQLRRKGRGLYLGRMEYLIRGLYFDTSAFSKTSFYPTVFVQPLYKPVDYLVFTFGGRLRAPGDLVWDTAEDDSNLLLEGLTTAIEEQALPFLNRFLEPIDLAIATEAPPDRQFSWRTDDINVLETAAYSWLLAGNVRKAVAKFEEILASQKRQPDDRPWALDLQNRASAMLNRLRRGDEVGARNELTQWANQTSRALHLEDFRKEPKRSMPI